MQPLRLPLAFPSSCPLCYSFSFCFSFPFLLSSLHLGISCVMSCNPFCHVISNLLSCHAALVGGAVSVRGRKAPHAQTLRSQPALEWLRQKRRDQPLRGWRLPRAAHRQQRRHHFQGASNVIFASASWTSTSTSTSTSTLSKSLLCTYLRTDALLRGSRLRPK